MGSAITDPNRLWQHKVIYFQIDPDIEDNITQDIEFALTLWQENAAIMFSSGVGIGDILEFKRGEFDSEDSSVQQIGRDPTLLHQIIFVGDNASVEILVHEIGHILGLMHEHQRTDRDSHISILCNNLRGGHVIINPPFCMSTLDFVQNNVINLGTNYTNLTPYDLCSVMHYSAQNEGIKKDTAQEWFSVSDPAAAGQCIHGVGGHVGISGFDTLTINLLYGVNRPVSLHDNNHRSITLAKQILRNLSFDPGPITQGGEAFNTQARDALIAFQTARGLNPSGSVDTETWNKFADEIPWNIGPIHGPPNASSGPQVRLLQAFLFALGFNLVIDGVFGSIETEPALRILQGSQMFSSPSPSGIIASPTGVVDDPTEAILQFLLSGGLHTLN